MTRILKLLSLSLIALGMLAGVGFAQNQSFSPKQQGDIEKIIRGYLLKNPQVMQEIITSWQEYQRKNQAVLAQKRIENMRTAVITHKKQVFRSKHDFVHGNPKGNVTMVEFFDYNCGFCKRSLPDIVALVEKDKNLRLVLKEFPILGPSSVYASRAAIAAKKQKKYWQFHLALMRARGINQAKVLYIAKQVGLDTKKLLKDMADPQVAETIGATRALAEKLGINGTPAFVIADQPLPGAVGLATLRQRIAKVRADGGCKIC